MIIYHSTTFIIYHQYTLLKLLKAVVQENGPFGKTDLVENQSNFASKKYVFLSLII